MKFAVTIEEKIQGFKHRFLSGRPRRRLEQPSTRIRKKERRAIKREFVRRRKLQYRGLSWRQWWRFYRPANAEELKAALEGRAMRPHVATGTGIMAFDEFQEWPGYSQPEDTVIP